MDDPAYIVDQKTCGKCMYYSGGRGLKMCNYTLCTGKARSLTTMADCPVRLIGKRKDVPEIRLSELKGGLAVCME